MDDVAFSTKELALPNGLLPRRAELTIPALARSLVGRESEQHQLHTLLHDPACRLITLLGVGGVGKTHLALQVAHTLLAQAQYMHGVFFVALDAPLPSAIASERLAALIARSLGLAISESVPAADQVLDFLRERTLLLLFDDAEFLETGTDFVSLILAYAPEVKILATSRKRLGIAGETICIIDGLQYPLEQKDRPILEYSAVTLFAQLVHIQNPQIQITDQILADMSRICGLIDGLPLGIELAAGWASILSCSEIATELEQSLDLLTTDRPDLPARQRSLRVAFNSSWDLLVPTEQQALMQLALFHGSFSREAAEAVLHDPALTAGQRASLLNLLAGLINKSMIRREPAHTIGGPTRYRLPGVIRQYAAEQRSQQDTSQSSEQRHMQFCLGMLDRLTVQLRGPEQQVALARINADMADIRAAWRYAITTRDTARITRATPSLFHLYDMRSWFREGAEMFGLARRALATDHPEASTALALGCVLAREAWFTFYLGRIDEAARLFDQSVALLRAQEASAELIFPLNYQAAVMAYAGDYPRGLALAQEGLTVARTLKDQYGQAVACNILGQTAYDQGDDHAARTWSQQSLALEEQIGNRWSMAFSLVNLGKVAARTGGLVDARRLFRTSLDIRQQLGDIRGIAICLRYLADTAAALGELSDAADQYEQCYRLFGEIGDQWGMAESLRNLAQLAQALKEADVATRLLQEGLRLAITIQAKPQVIAILRILEQLMPNSDIDWQQALIQMATPTARVEPATPEVSQLLAWAANPATSAIRLDHALTVLRDRIAQSLAPVAITNSVPANNSNSAGLTARELEVLELVAQGLSDAQVAEALIVSRRTVTSHLSTIYSKFQVGSRTAAIRAARDSGLLKA